MKKMLKLFTAIAMLSLVISFAGCNMDTEDDLLEDAGKPVPGMQDGNNASGGSSTGGTGSIGGTGGAVGTGGGSTSPLWASFEGADMQVWENTAGLTPTDECLEIEVKNSEWWGMCFCNKADVAPGANAVTFNMSKVKKITFDAKATTALSIWVSQSNNAAEKKNDKTFAWTTEYETKTYTLLNPGTSDYGVLDIGGNSNPYEAVISIKNIKFYNSEGTEIVPTRNE